LAAVIALVPDDRLQHVIEPRYCTCYGDDIPEPDPSGMCPDCFRLVETQAADHQIASTR
jgi:hypothetical protein